MQKTGDLFSAYPALPLRDNLEQELFGPARPKILGSRFVDTSRRQSAEPGAEVLR